MLLIGTESTENNSGCNRNNRKHQKENLKNQKIGNGIVCQTYIIQLSCQAIIAPFWM